MKRRNSPNLSEADLAAHKAKNGGWDSEQIGKLKQAGVQPTTVPNLLKGNTTFYVNGPTNQVHTFPSSGAIKYELRYPPSVNTYWRQFQGRTILSKNAREYRKYILAALSPQKPILGRLKMVIELFPPDRRRRDLDNCGKGLIDALQHAGVYRDDEQIDELTFRRGPVEKGGRCTVDIREI